MDVFEELSQTRVTQIQSRTGALVNFPTDRDFLHLPTREQDGITNKVATERGDTPRRVRVVSFREGWRW